MMTSAPEEAVVDATLFDPLGGACLLTIFADRVGSILQPGLLHEICRRENLGSSRVGALLRVFEQLEIVARTNDCCSLRIAKAEAERLAAVLRGVAYAYHRYEDENEVEVALSPPAHPSRLMEALPKQGFAWARLYHTKDSLAELAGAAQERLVIVTPFVDHEGLDWITTLFKSSPHASLERFLVIRGRETQETALIDEYHPDLRGIGAKIFTYAIQHDPGTRALSVETFHAKIMLADWDKAYIGSANMTRWSRDFSMECGAILRGPCVKPVATLVGAILSIATELP